MGGLVGGVAGGSLASVAGGITGPVGAAIGAGIGGLFDQFVLIPALQGRTKTQRPQDLDIQSVAEGEPVIHCLGFHNRVAGQLVWLSDPQADPTSTGGKRGEPVQWRWRASFAMITAGNTTNRIESLWVDGEKVYDATPVVTRTGRTDDHLTLDWSSAYAVKWQASSSRWVVVAWTLRVSVVTDSNGVPVPDAPDLSEFRPGDLVSVTLNTSPVQVSRRFTGPDGPWECLASGKDSKGATFLDLQLAITLGGYPYGWRSDIVAAGPPASPPDPLTYGPFTHPIPTGTDCSFQLSNARNWKSGLLRDEINDFDQWRGAANQEPSSILSGVLGDGAPAFPTWSGFAIRDMNLAAWGNRIPLISAWVSESFSDRRVSDTVSTLLDDYAGLSGKINTTQLQNPANHDDATMFGYQWVGLQPTRSILDPLFAAYDIDAREENGAIHFHYGDERDLVGVGVYDLDTRVGGSRHGPRLQVGDPDDVEVPNVLDVRYRDVDKDMLDGNERVARDGLGPDTSQADTRVVAQLSLENLSMSAEQAKAAGQRILRDAHEQKTTVTVRLHSHYRRVQEGDILTIDGDATDAPHGQHWQLLVDRIDQGADYVVRCECFALSEVPGSSPLGQAHDRDYDDGVDLASPPLLLDVLDIAPLADTDMRTVGYYALVSPYGPTKRLPAGEIWREVDGGTDAHKLATIAKVAVGGYVKPDPGGPTGALPDRQASMLDTVSSIEVEIYHDELVSVTYDQLLAGANFALIGDEIVQFQTATLTDTRTYTLTGIMRGLRGTDDQTSTHARGDRFWFLGNASEDLPVQLVPQDLSEIGLEQTVSVVPVGTSVDDAPGRDVTFQGRTARPMPVANLLVRTLGNGDMVASWDRRARSRYRIFSEDAPPLVEPSESYAVDFASGTRLVTVSTNTATYTLAQQQSDGLTPGGSYSVGVSQEDSSTAAGMSRSVTFTAGTEYLGESAGTGHIVLEDGTLLEVNR